MTHVTQRWDHDCGIACLAMLTGRTYDAAHRIVTALPARRWGHGITRRTMAQLLGSCGWYLGDRRRDVEPVEDRNLVEVYWPGGAQPFHWVVLTADWTLHDPLMDGPMPLQLQPYGRQQRPTHNVMGYRLRCVSGVRELPPAWRPGPYRT